MRNYQYYIFSVFREIFTVLFAYIDFIYYLCTLTTLNMGTDE